MTPRSHVVSGMLALLLGVFFLSQVRADGMVIRPHEDRWLPSRERSQDVLILHQKGIQRMLLAIEVENPDAANLVWIVPVPANPGQVKVDILTGFPRVHGTEVFGGAKDYLETMGIVAAGMQVWPVAAVFVFYVLDSIFMRQDYGPHVKGPPPVAAKAEAKKSEPPLKVHQHVEKAGMVSEVITAREGGALYQYLEQKGLRIKQGALPVLDHYVGKDYTFIASWLGGAQAGSPAGREPEPVYARGIDVQFPSREIFFPLRPTSIYGGEIVPASIRVAGYVTPRPFADIVPHTKTEYHLIGSIGPEPPAIVHDFYETGGGRYTRIRINAASARLTDDLWITPSPPASGGLAAATFVAGHPVVTFIAAIVLLSVLISVLVGWLLYQDLRTRRGAMRLAVVGLANCLTFIGLLVSGIRALPKGRGRKAAFLASFSVLFIIAAFAASYGASGLLESLRP